MELTVELREIEEVRDIDSLSRAISCNTRLEGQRIRSLLTTDEELTIRREGDRIRRFKSRLVRETSIEQEC